MEQTEQELRKEPFKSRAERERSERFGDAFQPVFAEPDDWEIDGDRIIEPSFIDRTDEFPPRPPPPPKLSSVAAADPEIAMEADEELQEKQREWRFDRGSRFWSRDRLDIDIQDSDSADDARKPATGAVYEQYLDNSDLSAEEELPEPADESDNSDGYNPQDVDFHRDFWWIEPGKRSRMAKKRVYRESLRRNYYQRHSTDPYGDIAPTNAGLDAPQHQLHARITKQAGEWPVEVALYPDEELHVTPAGLADAADEDGDFGNGAHFAERWWQKPLHRERIQREWRQTHVLKPRRPHRLYNPDKPYPREPFVKWADQLFDWPEVKESFTTMGYAHHPDSPDEVEPLNRIVDPTKRVAAKAERVRNFGAGGAEIDLDLGNVHKRPTPQQIKRTFIVADAGSTFDTPVLPVAKALRNLVRQWEPTYNNACVGLRYWSYIGCSSAFVYFTCCRFEPYVAGLYPIEETRFYVPLTAAAISAHCLYYYGWRTLVWSYFWAQMTFASCVVLLYTYYHDYSNSFEPAWDQLFLGKDFSLEHLEEEGVGLSPGGLLNYFFGSQEKLNTRAILN